MSKTGSELDAEIAALQAKLDTLMTVRRAMADEHLRPLILRAYGVEVANNGRKRPYAKRGGSSKNLDKIAGFLESHANGWATLDEIAAGSKVPKPSVRQVVYMAHPGDFERRQRADSRQSEFRLRKPG